MHTDPHKRSFYADTGQSAMRIAVMLTVLAVTLTIAFVAGRAVVVPEDPSVVENRYTGLLQLAPDQQDRCEQFELDNRSGRLKYKGVGPCVDPGDDVTESGPIARIRGISDYFRSR